MNPSLANVTRLLTVAVLALLAGSATAGAQNPRGAAFETRPKIDNLSLRCHYTGELKNRVRVDLKVRHSDVRREAKYRRHFLKVRSKIRLERRNGSRLSTTVVRGKLRTGASGRLISHRYHGYFGRKASRRVLRFAGAGNNCRKGFRSGRKLTAQVRVSQALTRPGAVVSAASSGAKAAGALRSFDRKLGSANPPMFGTAITTATGGKDSTGIEVGKFTRLPIPDVAVTAAESRSVSVLLGTGTGGFAAAPGSPVDLSKLPGGSDNVPDTVVSGRLNGDAFTDLAVSTDFGRVAVLLGSSAGRFTAVPGPLTVVSPEPRAMAVGDLNGDSELDLAISHPVPSSELPNNLTVLLGDGNGGFSQAPGSPFPGAGRPFGVAIAQFTSEAKNDIAVADRDAPGVSLFLGTGLGGFSPAPASPFMAGSNPISIAAGDLNGDGKEDVAIGDLSVNKLTVLYGDGAGGLAAAPQTLPVGTAPLAIRIVDLNGDGRKDISTANINSNNVSVLLNGGGGSFSPAPGSPYPAGSKPGALDTGDLNGDGRPDLAVADFADNVVSVLLNNG